MKFLTSKGILFSLVGAITIGVVSLIGDKISLYKAEKRRQIVQEVIGSVNGSIFSDGEYVPRVQLRDKTYDVEYSFNNEMKSFVESLLRRYKSDHSAVVILDNNTGGILAAVGYTKKTNELNPQLVYSTTHPSASLFKIITSADLLRHTEVTPDTVFSVRGRGTTLYKYQLGDKVDRWTRYLSLEKAFAFSNNVVFGKAAIKNLSGSSIYQTASLMGFNKKLTRYLDLGRSQFIMPEDQYNLAEKASGFTSKTLISPVHAALLSSIVINDGKVIYPRLIKSVKSKDGKINWENQIRVTKALESKTAKGLQEMMETTVRRGTARSVHRGLRRKFRDEIIVGGKTGSLTGGLPYGKRDWITLYAAPQDGSLGKGISIAIMNINVKKWYVKSTFLAKKIINYYYQEVFPKLKSDLTQSTLNKTANKGV